MTKDLNKIQKIVFFCNGDCCMEKGADSNLARIKRSSKNILKKIFWRFNMLLICLLLGFSGSAQATFISGNVTDNVEQKSLPGIAVTIPELKMRVNTDNEGNYEIRSIF